MDTQVREASISASTWGGVLPRAGSALVVGLAIAAIALQDVEAAVLAGAGFLALGLLRFRAGSLGVFALTILSADVALWMGPGAYSNITHGEGFWETALPSVLTVAALTTVTAAVAGWVARRTETPPGRGPAAVQAAAAALAIAALVLSAVGIGGSTGAQEGDLRVSAEGVTFSDETLEASSGRIGILVSNSDLFWHTFTITELSVSVSVPVGAERLVAFEAAAGTYRFVCAIPGHKQAGMEGTLTVR